MFRSKRSILVKRLLKLRIVNAKNETSCEDASKDDLVKSVANSLLKRLKEATLENLANAIDNKGISSQCVMLPKEGLRLGKRTVAPHVLCCQLWRWPEITGDHLMKSLPECTSSDKNSICCNPYHWSRLILPDTPPPPYKATFDEKFSYTGSCSEGTSQEVGGTPTAFRQTDSSSTSSSAPYWCNVAYWELRQRIGRLFSVRDDTVNIFHKLPHGDGMCLEILQQDPGGGTTANDSNGDNSVARTREKIGHGLMLMREADGIWVYNRSDYPIFVNSPTLEILNSRTCVVKKVPPGYSLQIFDYKRCDLLQYAKEKHFTDGPYDPSSIRISFAKGWGPHYSRQFITSCPCWIEVLLRINR